MKHPKIYQACICYILLLESICSMAVFYTTAESATKVFRIASSPQKIWRINNSRNKLLPCLVRYWNILPTMRYTNGLGSTNAKKYPSIQLLINITAKCILLATITERRNVSGLWLCTHDRIIFSWVREDPSRIRFLNRHITIISLPLRRVHTRMSPSFWPCLPARPPSLPQPKTKDLNLYSTKMIKLWRKGRETKSPTNSHKSRAKYT